MPALFLFLRTHKRTVFLSLPPPLLPSASIPIPSFLLQMPILVFTSPLPPFREEKVSLSFLRVCVDSASPSSLPPLFLPQTWPPERRGGKSGG